MYANKTATTVPDPFFLVEILQNGRYRPTLGKRVLCLSGRIENINGFNFERLSELFGQR
jgi:hypothetical protein